MPKDRDDAQALVAAVREATLQPHLQYHPTPEQRELKARFWLEFRQNPIVDDTDVTPALVEDVLGRSVQGWLTDPKFWTWFSSKDTVRKNLEIAAEQASEWAMLALDPAFPLNDNARVQLVKYVLEFSGRSPPSRKEIKWADRDVAALNEDELNALIEKLSRKALKESGG